MRKITSTYADDTLRKLVENTLLILNSGHVILHFSLCNSNTQKWHVLPSVTEAALVTCAVHGVRCNAECSD